MTDAQWAVVRDAMPTPGWLEGRGGRPEGYCHRQMIDAVFYVTDNGTKWRSLPVDFPPWDRVYAFSRRWRKNDLPKELHDRLRDKVRLAEGRDVEPTAGIIDSQSVKAAASVPAASRGYDGGKKINGRRRHVITDCLGTILMVMVTAANVTDRQAARIMLPGLRERFRELTLVWADGGYTGRLVDCAKEELQLTLQIVKRSDDMKGFVVLSRRWVVERTLGWLMRSRRLVRDFEALPESSEAFIYWSQTMLMSRRLARTTRTTRTTVPVSSPVTTLAA
ncbi:IS5 family transposase [Streptomyces sp. KMM 9044]|uniref:IS5 family transposase n=1 Tax=Streptomyces sp. KMM 9044 TaxID=2744474 RepID=UPI0021511109|nr:IS5 family transposase [Streptomyces sp. KMM 9044]WAX80193.1 IS5 family transposase [Streptomyces sp. KMM 9044]